jgi:hypothetical protein
VLTLTVPEPPQSFSVLRSDGGQVAVASVTQKGPLHLFKHKLNGPVKKPLLPSVTLKVLDSLDDSKQIPVLTSYISDEDGADDMTLLVSYGNWLRLRFEKLKVSALDAASTIKREYSAHKKKGKNKQAQSLQDNDLVEVPNDVKHLQPGSEGLLQSTSDSKAKKRKNVGDGGEDAMAVDDGELPMEERLTNLTIEVPSGSTVPSSSKLSMLLSQGLTSKDPQIIQSVLSRWDEDIISTTLRSLPVQFIIPLLHEIRRMLGGKAQQNHSLLKWLKNIFQIHSAYLMACPSSEDLLSPFLSLLRSRETLYPQMCQLKGKLELIKGNISAKEYKSEQPNEALLVYQDELSDEEREEDTFLPSESEGGLESDDDLGVDDDEDDSSGDDEDSVVGVNDSEEESSSDSSEANTSKSKKSKKSQQGSKKTSNSNHKPVVNNLAEDSDDFMDADND